MENTATINIEYYNRLRDTEKLYLEMKKGVSCVVENRIGGHSMTEHYKYIVTVDEQIQALIYTNNEWAEKIAERNNAVASLVNQIAQLKTQPKPEFEKIKGFWKRLDFLLTGKLN